MSSENDFDDAAIVQLRPSRLVKNREAVTEASVGWRSLTGRMPDAQAAESLKETSASAVYRLPNATSAGLPVIAKRRRLTAIAEVAAYQTLARLRPHRPSALLGTLQINGCTWLYLEDFGRVSLDVGDDGHIEAFTAWLADIHRQPSPHGVPGLPRVTTSRYLDHLLRARRLIAVGLENPAVPYEERGSLRRLDRTLAAVHVRWDRVVLQARGFRDVLVHGDLQAKNVLIRQREGRLEAMPVDWEHCGWGLALPDLASLAFGPVGLPDRMEMYAAALGDPKMSRERVEVWARVGRFLNVLAAIEWVCTRLKTSWVRKPLQQLPGYEFRLINEARWLGIVD